MADAKLSALTELAAGPAATDLIYIVDGSTSKKITAAELLNPENFTAVTLPAAADELFISDAGAGRKITHDDLLFGANGTPSTQAHSDSAAIGTALDAARSDHKHAMPSASGGGPTQANQAAIEAETNEDTYIPPDLLRHSPGVAKAFVRIANAGTIIAGSYNIASITDSGTGDRTIVIDTDFSSINFVAVSNDADSPYNEDPSLPSHAPPAVGSSHLTMTRVASGGPTLNMTNYDADSSTVFFGDQ